MGRLACELTIARRDFRMEFYENKRNCATLFLLRPRNGLKGQNDVALEPPKCIHIYIYIYTAILGWHHTLYALCVGFQAHKGKEQNQQMLCERTLDKKERSRDRSPNVAQTSMRM